MTMKVWVRFVLVWLTTIGAGAVGSEILRFSPFLAFLLLLVAVFVFGAYYSLSGRKEKSQSL